MAEELTVQDRIRHNLRNKTYEATYDAVNAKIEEGKDEVRHGEGFWGVIKAFIFQIAEMLGLDKWLARMFGTPIPEKEEVQALSSQVADSVSRALTDDKFV